MSKSNQIVKTDARGRIVSPVSANLAWNICANDSKCAPYAGYALELYNGESSDASDAFAATICSAVRPESLQKPNETGSK